MNDLNLVCLTGHLSNDSVKHFPANEGMGEMCFGKLVAHYAYKKRDGSIAEGSAYHDLVGYGVVARWMQEAAGRHVLVQGKLGGKKDKETGIWRTQIEVKQISETDPSAGGSTAARTRQDPLDDVPF